MRCPNCYSKISDDCTFCTKCGHKIERERVCPSCQTVNDIYSRFCKNCGEQLVSDNKSNTKELNKETKHIDKRYALNIISLVSMGLMLLSFVIIAIALFTPFLYSSFFPMSDYTIIGWSSNILGGDIDFLFERYQYVIFANAIIMLVLLCTTFIVTSLFFGLDIPKFIKALKEKEYYDFSKRVTIVYALFVFTTVYFTKFVMNEDWVYVDGFGVFPLVVIILVPILLVTNCVVKESIENDCRIGLLLLRACFRLFVFVLAMVVVFNLGGNHFNIIAQQYEVTGSTVVKVGDMGLISYLLDNAHILTQSSAEYVAEALVYAGVTAIFEIVILSISCGLIRGSLSNNLRKKNNYILGAILSLIMLSLSALALVYDDLCATSLNKIDDAFKYNFKYVASLLSSPSIILCIVLSSFLVISNAVCLILDMKFDNNNPALKEEDANNE